MMKNCNDQKIEAKLETKINKYLFGDDKTRAIENCDFSNKILQEQSRRYYGNLPEEQKEKLENMQRIDIKIVWLEKTKQKRISEKTL